MKSFFVGYQPVSHDIRKKLAVAGAITVLGGAGLAALLALQQQPFDPGTFEFGETREFEGWFRSVPVPALRVPRPGQTQTESSFSRLPLVDVGKFGAPEELRLLDGRPLSLAGSLIFNAHLTMLELSPASWRVRPEPGPPPPEMVKSLGEMELVGEIVDSKCYLGVMKPGRSKTHRGCAVRCISGGIPPLLLVEDNEGNKRHFFLVSPDLRPINQAILDRVAEPVRVRGEAWLYDDLPVLTTDPASITRVSKW